MPEIVPQIFGFLGFLLSALGLLVFGFAGGRFAADGFRGSAWQTQVAIVIALFGAVVLLAHFATPGSAGAFALGAGASFLTGMMPRKKDDAAKAK